MRFAACLALSILACAGCRELGCTAVHFEIFNGSAQPLEGVSIHFDSSWSNVGSITPNRTAGGSWEQCPVSRSARLSFWDQATKDRIGIDVALPEAARASSRHDVSLRFSVASDRKTAAAEVLR